MEFMNWRNYLRPSWTGVDAASAWPREIAAGAWPLSATSIWRFLGGGGPATSLRKAADRLAPDFRRGAGGMRDAAFSPIGDRTARTPAGSRGLARAVRPLVHVLIAYELVDGEAVSPEYDTPAFRAELAQWFAPLALEWVWTPVTFANLGAVISHLQRTAHQRPLAVFNLCDGSEVDGYPGQSVIAALSAAGLPFTGASEAFYRTTTSKLLTKRRFMSSAVPTPATMKVENLDRDLARAAVELDFPVIVKPDVSAGSYGIQIDSVCRDIFSAKRRILALREDRYIEACDIFLETYVSGREFTVFAVEDPGLAMGLRVLTPCERVFDERLPELEKFVIYERHWDLPEARRSLPAGAPYCRHVPVSGPLRNELEALVRSAVRAVGGEGYARCDIRQDARTGKLYVLEVNSQCDLTGDPASEIGAILRFSGLEISDLVEAILDHALTRPVDASRKQDDSGR